MDEQALALLEVLARGPAGWRAWPAFLEALGKAIAGDALAVIVSERPEPDAATVVSTATAQHVLPGLLPRRRDGGPRIEALAPGAVFELPALGALANDRVIRTVTDATGLRPGPGIGVVLTADEARATALLLVLPQCGADWAPQDPERRLLARLAPFLAHFARLYQRFESAGALTSLLDHLVLGVVLLDSRGRVTYANRSAAELLGVEPGLSEPNENVSRDPRSEALYRTIRSSSGGEEDSHSHPVDGRRLHLLATSLDWPRPEGPTAQRFARALFIGDPKVASGDPIGNLGRAYGLTPGETRLAWLLVGDYSLAGAAEQLGITEGTARTVLKRVLAKTGTKRQASLVRLLLSGPAQVRASAPASRARPSRRS